MTTAVLELTAEDIDYLLTGMWAADIESQIIFEEEPAAVALWNRLAALYNGLPVTERGGNEYNSR